LLITIIVVLFSSIFIYLYVKNQEYMRSEKMANEYHLQTILYCEGIKEEIQLIKIHHLEEHLKSYGENFPTREHEYHLSIIDNHLKNISDLQEKFKAQNTALFEYDLVLRQVQRQSKTLREAWNTKNTNFLNFFDSFEKVLSNFSATIKQLQNLHKISHKKLENLQSDHMKDMNILYLYIFPFFLIGALVVLKILSIIKYIAIKQQRAEIFINTVDGVVWEANADPLKFTFISKQAERFFGYPIENWINQPTFWAEHIHPDDRKWAMNFCAEQTAKRLDHHFEYRMIKADNSVIWVKDLVNVVVDKGVVKLYGIMFDVTEQKEIEKALQKSERRLRESQKIAQLGQWELDIVNNKLHWSDEVYRIFDIDPSKFKASYEAFLETIHPDDREMVNQAYLNSLKNKVSYNIVHRLLLKDGTLKFVNESCRTEYDNEGNPLYSIGTVQDVTKYIKVKESLRKSEEKYRTLYENTPVMLHSIDSKGKLLSVNNYWLKIMGYEREEVIGKLSTDFLTESSQEYARKVVLPEFFKTGRCLDVSCQFVKKNGDIIDVLLSATSEKDEQGNIRSLAVLTDVTERKQAKMALAKSNSLLKAVIEQAPFGIQICEGTSDSWILTTINKEAQRINRITEKQHYGLGISDGKVVHPEKLTWQMLYPDGSPWKPQDAPLPVAMSQGKVSR